MITPLNQVRRNLGDDGDDQVLDDGLIQTLIQEADGDVDKATLAGWRVLAARYSQLVDTVEGNAAKKFSQLHAQALAMIDQWSGAERGPTAGRARCGRIRRQA